MALRIRFQYVTGTKLGYSVERLADGLFLDMMDTTFKSSPSQVIGILAESATPYLGLFRATLIATPVLQFSNGNYAISIHNTGAGNQVVAVLSAQMSSGDDNSVGASGGDLVAMTKSIWDYSTNSVSLAGSLGQLMKDNLDAKVSTRSVYAGGPVVSVTQPVTVGTNQDKSGYSLNANAVDLVAMTKSIWEYSTTSISLAGSVGQLMKDNLDAKVSTRSVYAGGPVVSVTQPVTVGTNQDKSGYSLNANGVDLVMVETGVNLRQAVSPILAATAGVISGASTGQITIKGGNNTATRIVATTDNIGNRTTVVLTLPV